MERYMLSRTSNYFSILIELFVTIKIICDSSIYIEDYISTKILAITLPRK